MTFNLSSQGSICNRYKYLCLISGIKNNRRGVRQRISGNNIVCRFTVSGRKQSDEYEQEPPEIPSPYSVEDWDIPIDEKMRQTVQACKPDIYQQTLMRSFVVGGVGMHSGKYSIIRVRPAYAMEGRYFVRVPEGTNEQYSSQVNDPAHQEEIEGVSAERREMITRLFAFYSGDQQEYGFDGTFEDWLEIHELLHYKPQQLDRLWHQSYDHFEEVLPKQEGENIIPATIEYCEPNPTIQVNVTRDEERVCSIEHLLASLEVCGVDNCRIEIEGGDEIPVFDGSALGWVQEIYKCGLRPAAQQGQDENMLTPKMYFCPSMPVQVNASQAHITYAPDVHFKCSYGIDMTPESSIIGKQWYHWDMFVNDPFYSEIAPARDWVPSMQSLYSLYELGFYRGGTEGNTIIAHKDNYLHPEMIRFPFDECARHRLIDLMGDLALLGRQGHGGIPMGHITAFNGCHELHHAFIMEMAEQLDAKNLQMYFPQTDDDLVMQQTKLTTHQIEQVLSWKYVVKQRRIEVEGMEEEYLELEKKYQEKIEKGENFEKIREDLINEFEIDVDSTGEPKIPEEMIEMVKAAKDKNPSDQGDGEMRVKDYDPEQVEQLQAEQEEGEMLEEGEQFEDYEEEGEEEEGEEYYEEEEEEEEDEDFDPEKEAELMDEDFDDIQDAEFTDVEDEEEEKEK